MHFSYSVTILSTASAVAAACSRSGLVTVRNRLVAESIQLPKAVEPFGFSDLAAQLKITQNNQLLNFTDQTAFGNITDLHSSYNITAVDTATCQISTFVIADERNRKDHTQNTTAILSFRLKTDNDHKITEFETLNALPGSHQLFSPNNLPPVAPPIWKALQATAAGKKLSRDQLLAPPNAYLDGIQSGKNNDALIAYECPRGENGVQTTEHCGANMDLFIWPVTDRRWVVDEETGVVQGAFFMHYKDGKGKLNQQGLRSANSGTGLWLHEYFKVLDGKVVAIQAAMQTLPSAYKDIWGSDSPPVSSSM